MTDERSEVIDGLFQLSTTNREEWQFAGHYGVEHNITATDLHEHINSIEPYTEDNTDWVSRCELFEQAVWLVQAIYDVEKGEWKWREQSKVEKKQQRKI